MATLIGVRSRDRAGTEDAGSLRLERHADLEALKSEWAPLAAASRNVFATWEWISTWWRHYGRGRPLDVVGCRSADGRLVAILPLYLSAAPPVRMIRFLGHDQGDQLGPICAPENLPGACQALRSALRTSRWAWDLFLGETVPGDAGLRQAIGGERLRREGSPVVRFGVSTWEELLARWSPNFRSQVRSRERRLAREGELRFRLSDGPEQLADDLDLLFRLHEARWGGQVTRFARNRTFHRAFSEIGQERGWIRLWFLELDGRPVAGWYGFRFQGVESYYQAGRDPTALHGSVGFVLLAQTVRSALEDGMREYRFLRGGEEYKYRFASDDVGLETVILARGTRGRAAMAVGLAAGRSRRARGILRRVL